MFEYLGRTTNTKIFRILIILAILYVLILLRKCLLPIFVSESFSQHGGNSDNIKFEIKRNDGIYDHFYANVYDQIYEPKLISETIAEFIITFSQANPAKSVMLDVGSGTGEQMAYIHNRGFTILGVDKSQDMVDHATTQYPELQIKVGDVETPMLYDKNTFSHILCTGGIQNPLYSLKDKRTFFRNCYAWLISNGYLILHLVDREKFDPIPPAGKSEVLKNPQTIASERITDTEISFVDFQYKSSYDFTMIDSILLTETFVDNATKSVRKNEQVRYIEDVETILSIARNCGFIVHGQTSLLEHGDENQYIYLLERPS
jgi:SAM-dependent methyltransferase